jgi:hypothetical protein
LVAWPGAAEPELEVATPEVEQVLPLVPVHPACAALGAVLEVEPDEVEVPALVVAVPSAAVTRAPVVIGVVVARTAGAPAVTDWAKAVDPARAMTTAVITWAGESLRMEDS